MFCIHMFSYIICKFSYIHMCTCWYGMSRLHIFVFQFIFTDWYFSILNIYIQILLHIKPIYSRLIVFMCHTITFVTESSMDLGIVWELTLENIKILENFNNKISSLWRKWLNKKTATIFNTFKFVLGSVLFDIEVCIFALTLIFWLKKVCSAVVSLL